MHGDPIDRSVATRLRRSAVRRVPLRLAGRLPEPVAVRVLSWRSVGRQDTSEHRIIDVPAPFSLEVYWLRNERTEGPAASVWLGSLELMRIDGLVGEPHVHYDLAWSRARRRANVAAHRRVEVDDVPAWLADELRLNLGYALSLQRSRRIRHLEVDEHALDAAAEEVEAWAAAAVERWLASPSA